MATARDNVYWTYEVAQTINSNPVASQIFRILLESSSLSGWALVKQANVTPDAANEALAILQKSGVVASQGTGLEAFYYVTQQGYQLRSAALA